MKKPLGILKATRKSPLETAVFLLIAASVITVGAAFMAVGAATLFARADASQATVTGGAQLVSDTTAAGGKAIKFAASAGNPQPTPADPPASNTTTGGRGGAMTNLNNVSFTGAGLTSKYHIYASHINTAKPIGLMLHFHGDGAADFTDYNKNSALDADGSTGLVQVARDYNMLFVSVKSPASGSNCSASSPCWWDNGNPNSDYVAALMQKLYGQYNIDKSRIWYTGYSGGAQLISQYLVLRHSDLIVGGGAVIFAGGGSPVGASADPKPIYKLADVSTVFRQNFRMFWFTGTNDYDDGDGYDSRTDANEGSAWYKNNGFTQTGSNFTYKITHDQVENDPAGYFGKITRQRIELAMPRP